VAYLLQTSRTLTQPTVPIVDHGSPYLRDLVSFVCPFAPGPMRDLARPSDTYPRVNGATLVGTAHGIALDCNASDRGAIGTAPAYVRPATQYVSLVARIMPKATPDANCQILGISYDNIDSGPFLWVGLAVEGGGNFSIFHNDGAGNFIAVGTTVPFASYLNQFVTVVAAIGMNRQMLYVNGVIAGTGVTGMNPAGIASTATAQFGFGVYRNGIGRNAAMYGYDGWIVQREISQAEARALSLPSERWSMYRVPSTRVFFDVGGAAQRRFFLY
jgi:hypothetical protein